MNLGTFGRRCFAVSVLLGAAASGVASESLVAGKGKPGGGPPPDPRIVFAREGNFSTFDLVLLNDDGSNEINLMAEYKVAHTEPNWGPNGYISFVRSWTDSTPGGIYWIRQDGSDLTFVQELRGAGWTRVRSLNPAWSPDGQWIVFADETDESFRDLFVMEIEWQNGTPQAGPVHRLTTTSDDSEAAPTWAPDNRRIVVGVQTNVGSEVRVLDLKLDSLDIRPCLDGSPTGPCVVAKQTIVDSQSYPQPFSWSMQPDWANNHDWIAFRADGDGDGYRGIWIADISRLPAVSFWEVDEDPALTRRSLCWSADDSNLVYSALSTGLVKGKNAPQDGLYKLQLDLTHDGTSILNLNPATGPGQLLSSDGLNGPTTADWKRTP